MKYPPQNYPYPQNYAPPQNYPPNYTLQNYAYHGQNYPHQNFINPSTIIFKN